MWVRGAVRLQMFRVSPNLRNISHIKTRITSYESYGSYGSRLLDCQQGHSDSPECYLNPYPLSAIPPAKVRSPAVLAVNEIFDA